MKKSEEYFNEQIEPHLHSTYMDDRVKEYAEMYHEEQIDEIIDKEALEYLQGCLVRYGANEVVSFAEADYALQIQSGNFEKKAIEAFDATMKHVNENIDPSFTEKDLYIFFKQQLKSKL